MKDTLDIFKYKIILASKSPRRLQLVKQMGFRVDTVHIDVDESYNSKMNLMDIPECLAKRKALEYDIDKLKNNEILLTADTMVFVDNESIEKPKDREQAIDFLTRLSGKKHDVVTGCCLKTNNESFTFSVNTNVYFRKLSVPEIENYVDNYSPYDKAGGYGIQEWIGTIGIEKIDGCFYNVMGLPTTQLFVEIKKLLNI